jgi:hypothetical protein
LHGGRRTRTPARLLGVLAGVLTVTFGLLLALTDHLANSPGVHIGSVQPSPKVVFSPTVTGTARVPIPDFSVTSGAVTAVEPAPVTVTVTVTARTGTGSAALAASPSPSLGVAPAAKPVSSPVAAAPTVIVVAGAAGSGGGSGWTDIAAVGTGMSGFAAIAAALAAFLALRRTGSSRRRRPAGGSPKR